MLAKAAAVASQARGSSETSQGVTPFSPMLAPEASGDMLSFVKDLRDKVNAKQEKQVGAGFM
jgi:hypothetical protein